MCNVITRNVEWENNIMIYQEGGDGETEGGIWGETGLYDRGVYASIL